MSQKNTWKCPLIPEIILERGNPTRQTNLNLPKYKATFCKSNAEGSTNAHAVIPMVKSMTSQQIEHYLEQIHVAGMKQYHETQHHNF
jgi:hypothetical protein